MGPRRLRRIVVKTTGTLLLACCAARAEATSPVAAIATTPLVPTLAAELVARVSTAQVGTLPAFFLIRMCSAESELNCSRKLPRMFPALHC